MFGIGDHDDQQDDNVTPGADDQATAPAADAAAPEEAAPAAEMVTEGDEAVADTPKEEAEGESGE